MTIHENTFKLVDHKRTESIDPELLKKRPGAAIKKSFAEDARLFVPGDDLELAINTAIAIGEPLLLTGDPGTGKTQAAYYTAYKLGVEPVLHVQVKSTSKASDVLYSFDTVRYFHDATILSKQHEVVGGGAVREIDKKEYADRRALWEAFESSTPRVVLIDEIDKAPRDFPNDLLHELDKMDFTVSETKQRVTAEARPIVFITSNRERPLPDAFLRRCVYHHIVFNESLLRRSIEKRRMQYTNLSPEFIDLAVQRFLAFQNLGLQRPPSTGECFVWLKLLDLTFGPEGLKKLGGTLAETPFLSTLVKGEPLP